MRRLLRKARRLMNDARDVVFPERLVDPDIDTAEARAEARWETLFAPFQSLTEDADILEIGCGDGRLLQGRFQASPDQGPARSAVGLDHVDYWNGQGGAVALGPEGAGSRIELHNDVRYIHALDGASFDLILCHNFETMFELAEVEDVLRRLYDLLRPGGDFLVVVGCPDLASDDSRGPGYGVLTPSSWMMLMMRAGFEVRSVRRQWKSAEAAAAAAAILPLASEEERMTAELRCHLIRPWEAAELDQLWTA
ncbi:class I SAM-dependent methyltransferase [Brevundimonas sp.]|uniref:class I SAM-dependent methyltransferase n=1 Tax=Brevundimonas sp. TaxID=1871086 RepID=UPI003BA8A2E0